MHRIVAFVRSGVHPGLTEGLSKQGEEQVRLLIVELLKAFAEERVSRPRIFYTVYNKTLYMGREETALMIAAAFDVSREEVCILDSIAADQLTHEIREIEVRAGEREGIIIVTSSEHAMAMIQRIANRFGRVLPIPELFPGRVHILYPDHSNGSLRYDFLLPKTARSF